MPLVSSKYREKEVEYWEASYFLVSVSVFCGCVNSPFSLTIGTGGITNRLLFFWRRALQNHL